MLTTYDVLTSVKAQLGLAYLDEFSLVKKADVYINNYNAVLHRGMCEYLRLERKVRLTVWRQEEWGTAEHI